MESVEQVKNGGFCYCCKLNTISQGSNLSICQLQDTRLFTVPIRSKQNILAGNELFCPAWQTTFDVGGSPGLVVMGGDSNFEGCGFESRHRTLGGHDIFSQ